MKNIVLVGFMGTGKTEAGKILATRLKRQRLCIDDMIEWKVGKPISRIFQEDGEVYFRKVESDIISAVSKDKNVVIDAGGGVVINEHNVRRLKEHGVLICLTARPEIILERTEGYMHRPLLNTQDPLGSIKRLLEERAEYYKRADYTIDTSDMKIDEVADKIINIMEEQESDKKLHLIFS
jgi:shikimate kinase